MRIPSVSTVCLSHGRQALSAVESALEKIAAFHSEDWSTRFSLSALLPALLAACIVYALARVTGRSLQTAKEETKRINDELPAALPIAKISDFLEKPAFDAGNVDMITLEIKSWEVPVLKSENVSTVQNDAATLDCGVSNAEKQELEEPPKYLNEQQEIFQDDVTLPVCGPTEQQETDPEPEKSVVSAAMEGGFVDRSDVSQETVLPTVEKPTAESRDDDYPACILQSSPKTSLSGQLSSLPAQLFQETPGTSVALSSVAASPVLERKKSAATIDSGFCSTPSGDAEMHDYFSPQRIVLPSSVDWPIRKAHRSLSISSDMSTGSASDSIYGGDRLSQLRRKLKHTRSFARHSPGIFNTERFAIFEESISPEVETSRWTAVEDVD